MSDRPSFWCSSFSRFWWWLLALLGLPLLLFLMNYFQQPKIEADLTTRVSAALAAENIHWAEVNVQQRGRDVLLQGEPDSDIEREHAQQVALGVYGVNRVDFAGNQTGQDMTPGQSNTLETSADDQAGQDMASENAEESTKPAEDDQAEQNMAQEEVEETNKPSEGDQAGQQTAELTVPDSENKNEDMVSAEQEPAVENATEVPTEPVAQENADTEGKLSPPELPATMQTEISKSSGEPKTNTDPSALSDEAAEAGNAEKLTEQTATVRAEACQSRLNTAMQDRKIQFTFNDASINSASNALLDDLAQIIRECSDVMAGRVIVIGGHTDSVGQDAYNLDLSQRRANSVRDYLRGKQIDEALLEAKGFGESQPVASNKTAQGQAQNRRITFEIKQQ